MSFKYRQLFLILEFHDRVNGPAHLMGSPNLAPIDKVYSRHYVCWCKNHTYWIMRAPRHTFSYPYPHPAVTTDVVVFAIRDGHLNILLVKRGNPPFEGRWALPGGFLNIDEDLDSCAARELEEETGIGGLYLEQLYTFGNTHRDPRERVISVTYYALVPLDALATPRAASDAAEVGWHPFDDLPSLAFDHADIVRMAHQRLVAKLDYSTIAFGFMHPERTAGRLRDSAQAATRQTQFPQAHSVTRPDRGNGQTTPKR